MVHANFFFIDIVSLSDPKLSTKSQIKKIEGLTSCLLECNTYKTTPKENLLLNTTGDGFWLGFLQGPELPLRLAIELQARLAEYNKSRIPSETINVRIGLHSGISYVVKNITGNLDIWGPGIILTRRVMDLGDDGHILLSPRLAEDLCELSDEYKKIIRPIHDYTIKHGTTMLIYSAFGDGFGNPKSPTKGIVDKSMMGKEIPKIQKSTIYPSASVELLIQNHDTMLVHHKRTYELENISDEPIQYVLHGIGTDVKKDSINDLNILVRDESGQPMRISSITMDKPYSKEFSTAFNRPIQRQEKNRGFTLEYDVEEPNRYFENAFLVDCKKFALSLEHDKNAPIKPVLFELNQETEQKKALTTVPHIAQSDNKVSLRWEFENLTRGYTLRLEW
ncbi:hypothetical protein SU86_007505 [Candidatus Nitrosotenuis cloacae]|uniref:Guanylate cyclase domain-containing protein n=1 Tax=Candidatus Nitrosotenuis cloacae TaxID=1603555 RepID=A0A3G1B7P5_9ARCH|nr:hypothetical protein SU86_007505 [Candidatus Nitrosotenuis cloacae]